MLKDLDKSITGYFDFIIDRTKKQRWENYIDFLNSIQWREKKKLVFEYWGNDCFQCLNKAELVHHLNYNELWGDERINRDLIPLCKKCHKHIHIDFIPQKFSSSMIYNYKVKEKLFRCGKIGT